jgi:dihydroxyacetone kinase DhaKLM complex PTS-EIIA-like component DhaM
MNSYVSYEQNNNNNLFISYELITDNINSSYSNELINDSINSFISNELTTDSFNLSYSNELASDIINSSYSYKLIDNINNPHISYETINNSFYSSNSNYITNDIIIFKETKKINITESLQTIINNFVKNINLTDINNGIDKKTKSNNSFIVFTSTINQKNNEDKSNITMNLGQCETKLKNSYNISENEPLYIIEVILV